MRRAGFQQGGSGVSLAGIVMESKGKVVTLESLSLLDS